ncbi:hypothetical protein MNBD_GAMMA22-2635 [hydrothermal vent metagenome]|uniref:General secretion pathway GspH domain-containing protein n=1 Tax=hydrothermal vent metagenome TaxID=652676 RepID=A0A3B0ZHJ3_9ZZZZ
MFKIVNRIQASPTIKQQSGFTLVELLVTMAVFGIALSIAVPNYKSMANSNRLVSQINTFSGAIAFARSEAIKQGVNIILTPLDATATPINWAKGWNVELASNNQILKRIERFNAGTKLESATNVANISLTGDGRINTVANLVFNLCNEGTLVTAQDKKGRSLTISPTGTTYLDSNYTC